MDSAVRPSEKAAVLQDAAELRRTLAAYSGVIPIPEHLLASEAPRGTTMERVEKCCDMVSRKDAFSRAEAAGVLQVLLRAERMADEHRRAAAAADRRWVALTAEGKLLTEKGRNIRTAVQKLRQREAEARKAVGEQKLQLLSSLANEVMRRGSDEEREAVSKVQAQIGQLASACQKMHEEIATSQDEAARWATKQRGAQRRCKLTENLIKEATAAKDSAASPGDSAINLMEEIVELEQVNEGLQWELYHIEQQAFHEASVQPALAAPGLLDEQGHHAAPSFWRPAPCPISQPEVLVGVKSDARPPQGDVPAFEDKAIEHEAAVPEEKQIEAPKPLDPLPAISPLEVDPEKEQVPEVTSRRSSRKRSEKELAEFCQRLALPPSERRELAREKREARSRSSSLQGGAEKTRRPSLSRRRTQDDLGSSEPPPKLPEKERGSSAGRRDDDGQRADVLAPFGLTAVGQQTWSSPPPLPQPAAPVSLHSRPPSPSAEKHVQDTPDFADSLDSMCAAAAAGRQHRTPPPRVPSPSKFGGAVVRSLSLDAPGGTKVEACSADRDRPAASAAAAAMLAPPRPGGASMSDAFSFSPSRRMLPEMDASSKLAAGQVMRVAAGEPRGQRPSDFWDASPPTYLPGFDLVGLPPMAGETVSSASIASAKPTVPLRSPVPPLASPPPLPVQVRSLKLGDD